MTTANHPDNDTDEGAKPTSHENGGAAHPDEGAKPTNHENGRAAHRASSDTSASTEEQPASSSNSRGSLRERLRQAIESEETDPLEFIRRFDPRRGQIEGRAIAIPFTLLTLGACALSFVSLWSERPLFSFYTLGLYACVWFMGNGYREAWLHQNYVRQLSALIFVVIVLSLLALIHGDDASTRVIYEQGTRMVREERVSFYIAAGMSATAAVIIVLHGLGLGFGSRIYDKETGERVSHNVAREVYDIARERIAERDKDEEEPNDEQNGEQESDIMSAKADDDTSSKDPTS